MPIVRIKAQAWLMPLQVHDPESAIEARRFPRA